ncbi:hypothetical protein SLA_0514 [Streptomyces laurentii]|uniref:Uncharacterized protein n=1 Tax=Streptomyces laurentii TaxID=39478 RepID=A0A160NSV9_STRLU|nr:hypothetical protein SLA_0514 [Streptomyces laurentii]
MRRSRNPLCRIAGTAAVAVLAGGAVLAVAPAAAGQGAHLRTVAAVLVDESPDDFTWPVAPVTPALPGTSGGAGA